MKSDKKSTDSIPLNRLKVTIQVKNQVCGICRKNHMELVYTTEAILEHLKSSCIFVGCIWTLRSVVVNPF